METLYTYTETARELGVSVMTVYRWTKNGKLTPINIAPERMYPKWRISGGELDRIKRKAGSH
jgi:predicted site-specific integrase-resolvase